MPSVWTVLLLICLPSAGPIGPFVVCPRNASENSTLDFAWPMSLPTSVNTPFVLLCGEKATLASRPATPSGCQPAGAFEFRKSSASGAVK